MKVIYLNTINSSRSDLSDLIGVPGYDEEAIRYLLDMGDNEYGSWITQILNILKNRK